MTTVAEYRQLAKEQFPDIDIGLLVLNAGVMVPYFPYDMSTDEQAESTFAINGLHVVYMTKALVERLQQREKRSGLIIVSSGLANVKMPGVASYCATKAMVSAFGTGIHYELKEKIDVLVWEAGAAKTGLGGGEESPPEAICA